MDGHPSNCVCGCHDEHKDTLGDDLYEMIDLKQLVCLNEAKANSCLNAFRPITEALDFSALPFLESNEGDPDLLLRV